MGTSQRHNPSVVGDPNWGQSSQAITQVGKDVKELNTLGSNSHMHPKQVKRARVLTQRIRKNISKSVSRTVNASGGKQSVVRGTSSAFGKRGISYGTTLYSALHNIAEKGFKAWAEEKGYTNLSSISSEQVIDTLYDYIHEAGTTLDDTAANDAVRMLLRDLEKEAKKAGIGVEELLEQKPSENLIKKCIDDYFGYYVYSHISQNFSEKLEKQYGIKLTSEIKTEIRRTILDDIRRGTHGKDAVQIDWKGKEGRDIIEKEFSLIIDILTSND